MYFHNLYPDEIAFQAKNINNNNAIFNIIIWKIYLLERTVYTAQTALLASNIIRGGIAKLMLEY
jgi:hypothetical protein